MSNIYITADQVGRPDHGGGSVTWNESEALKALRPCEVWGREQLEQVFRQLGGTDPWDWDTASVLKLPLPSDEFYERAKFPTLAHFYAGCFTKTVGRLREKGTKVCYTAAAHDIAASRKAHEELGIPYDYPHLTDPVLWKRYVRGYLEADVLVCPSTHSANVMRGFGAKNRIEIIPHGVDLPKCGRCEGSGKAHGADRPFEWAGPGSYPGSCPLCGGTCVASIAPLPSRFTVGYLGAVGPDKGLIDLLRAWRNLQCPDAELVLAGGQSNSGFVQSLINHVNNEQKRGFTGPPIRLMGWVENVSDFYNQISLYVQPSRSEGFGIEVLEAMAHGRPVLCSTGAGAADLVPAWYRFPAGNAAVLADLIDQVHLRGGCAGTGYPDWRGIAAAHTWDKIRQRYQSLWRDVLK